METSIRRKSDLQQRCKDFLKCRNILNAYCGEANIGDIVQLQEKSIFDHVTGKYDPNCRQVDSNGVVINSIDDLFSIATTTSTKLEKTLSIIIKENGLKPNSLMTTPLKSIDAIKLKAKNEYSSRLVGPSISWIHDVVRCSVVCDTVDEFLKMFKSLNSTKDLKIISIKNRFATPLVTGFRDVLIHAKLFPNVDNIKVFHIVEIQLHLKAIYELSTKQNSYALYEYFRGYFASSYGTTSSVDADGSEGGVNKSILEANLNEKVSIITRVAQFPSATDTENSSSMDLWGALVDEYISEGGSKYTSSQLTALQALVTRLGEFYLAEKLQRKALALDLAEYGSDNDPHVIESMHQLMIVLKGKKDYAGTEDMCRRLVKARQAVYGDTMDTAKTLDKLAEMLFRQKVYEESESTYYSALAMKESLLGAEHETTLNTMDQLIEVLRAQEKYEDAVGILEVALETREKILGRDAAITMNNRFNYSLLLIKLRRLEEAEKSLKILHDSRAKLFGSTHPQTITVLNLLGQLYEDTERYVEADAAHLKCLKAREKALGGDHKDTLTSVFNLANTAHKLNKPGRAAFNYYRAYRGFLSIHGEEHPKTMFVYNKAKSCLAESNKQPPTNQEDAKLHLQNNIFGPGKIDRVFEHAKQCEQCDAPFTLVNREHHCRLCYKAVCHACSPTKVHVPLLHAKQHVRVCSVCKTALDVSPRIPELYNVKPSPH